MVPKGSQIDKQSNKVNSRREMFKRVYDVWKQEPWDRRKLTHSLTVPFITWVMHWLLMAVKGLTLLANMQYTIIYNSG